MPQPYKTPADSATPVPDTSPVVGPLTAFAKHEKNLAIIGVYRSAIGACRNIEALEKLKLYARGETDTRITKTNTPVKNPVIDAVTWFHTLTVEDCQYFRADGDTVVVKESILWEQHRWPIVLGAAGALTWYLLEHLL